MSTLQPVLARCGNRCDLCPLYRENFNRIGAERINSGLFKYQQRGTGTPPRFDRECDGCLSGGYIARQDCPIRTCTAQRQLPNCAGCADLFCDLLEADMKVIESAVRDFKGAISAEDFDLFLEPFLIRSRLAEMRTQR